MQSADLPRCACSKLGADSKMRARNVHRVTDDVELRKVKCLREKRNFTKGDSAALMRSRGVVIDVEKRTVGDRDDD